MLKKIIDFLKKKKIWILLTIIPGLFILVIVWFPLSETKEYHLDNAKVTSFNDGWYTKENNEITKLETLPTKIYTKPGSSQQIFHLLPMYINDNTVLAIHSSKQELDVSVGGKLIYTYKSPSAFFDKYPMNATVFVPLKPEYSEKEISITLRSYSMGDSGRIDEIYMGDEYTCVRESIRLHSPLLFLYILLFSLGLALVLFFLFISSHRKRYSELLYLGMIMMLLSIFIITGNNMLQILIGYGKLTSILFVSSLVMIPFPYLAYIYTISKSRRTKRILSALAIAFGILGVLLLPLHITHTIDLSISISLYLLLLVLSFTGTIVMMILEIVIDRNFEIISTYLASNILITAIVIEWFGFYQFIGTYRHTGVFVGAGLLSYFGIMGALSSNRIVKNLEELGVVKEELLQSKVSLMLSQIQPHFIYNTLNSIQALIDIDPTRASKLVVQFSRYLRGHIDTIGHESNISFQEELHNVKAYLAIEQVRFPKISVLYDIQSDQFQVPTLTIQPLVENAIRHGVSKSLHGGTVVIRTYEDTDNYVVQVIDDGVGFEIDIMSHKKRSAGIKNITFRLNQILGATINFQSSPHRGTTVTIRIPFSRKRTLNEDDVSR